MPNHKLAIKRMKQSEKRRLFNRNYRNRARTLVKKARTAITKRTADVTEAVRAAIKDLDMAASRGVLHKKNAARRKSRLMKQFAAIQAKK